MSPRNWDTRVNSAETIARGAGFQELRARIVELAGVQPGQEVVDLGAGTGLLTFAVAGNASRVWAVDFSQAMCDYLAVKAKSAGLDNIEVVHASATNLPLVDASVDVVVSNYCLHELRDEDKHLALAEVMRVLRPGGRFVFGDMMFSIEMRSGRDRELVAAKVRAIAARGLPGLWRLAKNAARLAAGNWEHPVNAEWWRAALANAGFREIELQTLPHEGGIAAANAPAAGATPGEAAQRPAAPVGV